MNKVEYKGFIKYKFLTDEDMADFYENLQINTLGLAINEYALLSDSKSIPPINIGRFASTINIITLKIF